MALVFYDTETTGISTAFDQIVQFAAIRTDAELNEIDRFEIRSRLLHDVVPSPGALCVTGMTVDDLSDPSLPSHYEMVRAIREKLTSWSTAVFLGYNSIAFDEHLLRQALYKTLHRPYLTNTEGNGRSDVMRMLQAVSIFSPRSIQVPVGDEGRAVFRLDEIAPANGIRHEHAHDAMADVLATVELCRLAMERAPEIWSSFMRFGQKAAVADFVTSERVFSLSDFYFGLPYSWLVTVIGANAENASEFLALDLAVDPDSLERLSDIQLAARIARSPKAIRRIKSNSSPIIMLAEDAPAIARTAFGAAELERRADRLHGNPELIARLLAAFESASKAKEPSPHVEQQIYDGFFSPSDERLLDEFHEAPWERRWGIVERLADARLQHLGRRLIHAEHPTAMPEMERAKHDRAVTKRILGTEADAPWMTLPKALQEADELLASSDPAQRSFLLKVKQDIAKLQRRAVAATK